MKNKYMYIVYVGIAFLVVIIIFLILTYATPLNKNKETKINEYKNISINKSEVVKRYINNILILISNKEKSELWKITDKDFLELYNIKNEDELLKYLNDAKLSELMNISIEGYSNYVYNNNNIYIVSLKNIAGKKLKSITINETSPKNYTIAFDDFIELHKINKTIPGNSISLKIDKIISYEKLIRFEVSFLNNTDKDIIIKGDFKNDNVSINYADKMLLPMNATFGNSENIIKSKQSNSKKIDFSMSFARYSQFNSISLSNIINDGKIITETYNLK